MTQPGETYLTPAQQTQNDKLHNPVQQNYDVVDQMERLATGNAHLQTRPDILGALASGNVSVGQAASIDSFMNGLDAQQQVNLARQAGSKVTLGTDQMNALDAMGVNYDDVQYTQQDAEADAQKAEITAAATKGQTPVLDQTGNPIIGADGNVVMQTAADETSVAKKKSSGGGWFDGFGDFGHHLLHNPVTNTISGAYNVVDSSLSQAVQQNWDELTTGNGATFTPKSIELSQQQTNDMTAAGYDPGNPFSVIAYKAKGLAHTDTSDLVNAWDAQNPGKFGWDGQTALQMAESYNANPDAFIHTIATDPHMTDADKAAIITGGGPFYKMAAEVAGRSATLGNEFARGVGLDPVKNPTAFGYVSAGSDLIASFAIDPTIAVVGGVRAARVASIGIKDISDAERIRTILNPNTINPFRQSVQRGWQSLLGDANTIRTADDSTDAGKIAISQAYAHAHAATPGIVDLLPHLTGAQAVDAAGHLVSGTPIRTLSELTDYLASGTGLARLTGGKAAIESALMPGSMSVFGYRFLKGEAAGKIAARSQTLNLRLQSNAEKLINLNPADAVDASTGERIVQHVQENPASDIREGTGPVNTTTPAVAGAIDNAERAKSAIGDINAEGPTVTDPDSLPSADRAMTAAQKGDLTLALRKSAGPAGTWARLKLAGQRMSSLLPRNDVVKIGDEASMEKIYRFGLEFLNKGDAALYAGMWAKGGEGAQKAVIDGVIQQTAHAAGLGTTEAGKALLDELPDLNAQAYGHTGAERITDPVTGQVRDVAVWPQQVRQEFYLPSFQTLYRASAKLGVWQNTVGRVFNSTAADTFMDYARLAALLKPNIAWRNIIEGQGHVALRGEYVKMLAFKARAVDTAKALADKAEAGLRESGVTDRKTIAAARRTAAGTIQTQRKAVLDKAISVTQLDHVGWLYRKAIGVAMPQAMRDELNNLYTRYADEVRPDVLGYGRQIAEEHADPLGVHQTDKILKQGFRPQRYKRVGFGMSDVNGGVGGDRYSYALNTRFGQFPDVDRAVIEAIKNPSGDLDGVVDALNLPHVRSTVDQMVRAHQYTDTTGVSRLANTPAEKALAIRGIAQSMVADGKYLMTDINDNHISKVSDYIFEHGAAPSGKWVRENLEDAERPKAALAPQYRALADNGFGGFIRTILDSAGAGYKALVEDAIKRTTTEPVYTMHWVMQKVLLDGVKQKMINEGGLTEEASDRIVKDLAVKRAYNQTEAMIDDPGLKTQADIVGKNFLYFSRAVQAFARRWGGLAVENPAAFRKLFLVNEAAHHAGLTYTDANGNVNFTYPGSDLLMNAMGRLSDVVPGLGPAVTYPLAGSLTGQVNMLAPGLNNPARFSLSPMLNTPMHLLEQLSPKDREMWDELDTALNGEDSNGKSWYSELVPGAVSKITSATATDRNSALNSATVSAIANLAAVDPDGSKGIFPTANSTPAQVDKFLANVKTQVKNQLYLRAAIGEFAPAAPGLPLETNSASKADPLFSHLGVQNLSDEYKHLLNDVGGDTALASAIFVANDPTRSIYTQATSQTTSNKAYLPSTAVAENWINNNRGFINDYKGLAAYFVPQDDGDFDLAAYRAQIETGLREKKTPDEFYNQYRINTAASVFYPSLDAKNAKVAADLNSGNTKQATIDRQNFSAWEDQFNAVNPIWAANDDLQQSQQTALGTIADMNRLVADQNAPANVRAYVPQMTAMLQTYNTQQQWLAAHPAYSAAQIAGNQAELADYEDHMTGIINGDPNLQNIYNGVFKPLNYKQ